MTELHSITRDLQKLVHELYAANDNLAASLDEAAVAEHEYKKAYAMAYMAATGTVQQREHTAFLETEQLRLDSEVAKAGLSAAKARLSTIETHIEVARTLNASNRAEMRLGGVGV